MPSKLEYEFTKLRGRLASTQKFYNETMSDLKEDLNTLSVTITEAESNIKNALQKDIRALKATAIAAENKSLSTSGGNMTGEINMTGHDIIGISDFEAKDNAGIGFYNESSGLTLGIDSTGNLTPQGTVDGRDLNTDGSKLDGIASGADVTANNYEEISVAASDNLLWSNPAMKWTNSQSYVKKKEVAFTNATGVVRVGFTLTCAGYHAFGRVYIDGVAVGAEHEHLGGAPTSFSDDVAVTPGCLIQIYAKRTDGSSVDVTNMIISGIRSSYTFTNQDP